MKKRILPVLFCLCLLSGCVAADGPAPVPSTPPPAPAVEVVTPEPMPTPEPTPTPPTVAALLICGDAMAHNDLSRDALDSGTGEYDYSHIFAAAAPYAQSADYAVVNLETPLAGGEPSGYPRFSAADAMAQNLKDAGFDLCLTANNHCLDKGQKGLMRTLDVLDEVGLAHVGTSRTQEEHDNNVVLADVGGISVAFLGYTYGTNGLALPSDAPYIANVYNKDYMTSLADPDYDYLLRGLETAKALKPDLVAVLIHWGIEYKLTQNHYQEEVADFLFENGADLVLGGHPHVLQPLGFRELPDGRQGFVSYSLGNFFSSQTKENTDVTALLSLELTRDNETGKTQVTGCSYVPMLMHRERQHSGFALLDAYASLEAGVEEPKMEERLRGAIELCHQVLGEELDPKADTLPQFTAPVPSVTPTP